MSTSTQTKHTPGPLHIREALQKSDGGTDFAIVDQDHKVIGEAFEVVGTGDRRPAYANARLWVAAPDLLAALAYIATVDISFRPDQDPRTRFKVLQNQARAAMAKATETT